MSKILAFDPSGNHGREGMGTSGLCFMRDGNPFNLDRISAEEFENEIKYWDAQVQLIEAWRPDHVVIEGYKLYNHKGKEAKIQAHSDMQTSQLIGVLKMTCYHLDIPYTIQYASDVKTRWNDDLLVRQGYLKKSNGFYYFKEKRTATHHRDALRHALHFDRYGKKAE